MSDEAFDKKDLGHQIELKHVREGLGVIDFNENRGTFSRETILYSLTININNYLKLPCVYVV